MYAKSGKIPDAGRMAPLALYMLDLGILDVGHMAPLAVAKIVRCLGFGVNAGGGSGCSLPWASGYIHAWGPCYVCWVGGDGVRDMVCAGSGTAIYVQV